MSRTKGYKCYNIQCGSCIGKTLCGEPGDAALSCQDRVVDSWTAVDYEKLAYSVKLCGSTPKVDQCRKCPYWADGDMSKCIPRMTTDCSTAITDLLSRAEVAEAELKQKETYYNQMVDALAATDSFEKQKLCEEADHLKDLLKEAEARAEKAEMERDAAANDLKEEVMGKIWACEYCKKNDPENFQCKRDDLCGCSEWEWRGQKEE